MDAVADVYQASSGPSGLAEVAHLSLVRANTSTVLEYLQKPLHYSTTDFLSGDAPSSLLDTRSVTTVKPQSKKARDMMVLIKEERNYMMKGLLELTGTYWSEIGEYPEIGF